MNRKHYWLYLEPYIHTSIKKKVESGQRVLLYNPFNGKILEYSNRHEIIRLIRRLKSKKNLFVTKLTAKDLGSPEVKKFVSQVRKYYMGDLLDGSRSLGKPFQMMPMLNLQKDPKRLKREFKEKYIDAFTDNVMSYLREIVLYLNNRCDQNCEICQDAHKQCRFCTKTSGKNREPGIDVIKRLFVEASGSSIYRYSILGGNVLKYSEFERLIDSLGTLKLEKCFYVHYLHLEDQYKKRLDLLKNGQCNLNILIHFPVDRDKLRFALDLINKVEITAEFRVLIKREQETEQIEDLMEGFGIRDYSVYPFFDGRNMTFFKKHVFLKKNDIVESRPSQKEIFSEMVINPMDFGKLIVSADGNIHANINHGKIGNIEKNALIDIVSREVLRGKSWRSVRRKVEPCKHCTYNALCPPLSNYEYFMQRNNLCHILRVE
jgi:pseudo-rSAM protein